MEQLEADVSIRLWLQLRTDLTFNLIMFDMEQEMQNVNAIIYW